jgi:hypothetical protein
LTIDLSPDQPGIYESEFMSLFCKLLGHKVPPGYGSQYGTHYLKVHFAAIDGLDIEHATLHADCERCDKTFQVGKIHLPVRQAELNLRRRLERSQEEVINLQKDNAKRRGYSNPLLDAVAADFNYEAYCQMLIEVKSTAPPMKKEAFDKFKADILALRAAAQTVEPRHGQG